MKENENIEVNGQQEDLSNLYQYKGAPSQARYEAMRADMHMGPPRREDPKLTPLHNLMKTDRVIGAFKHTGFHYDAPTRMSNVFRFYLMAKKDMDFDAAWEYVPGQPDFDKNFEEFTKFLEDHPISGENLSPEKKAENSVELAQIFMGAAEKMKSYKIPDIDYSDPVAAEKEYEKFKRLINSEIDFGQELNDRLMEDGDAAAIKNTLGSEYFEKQSAVWLKSQPFLQAYLNAYDYADFGHKTQRPQLEVQARLIGLNRYELGEMGKQLRGKTFGEVFTDRMTAEQIAYASLDSEGQTELTTNRDAYTFDDALSYVQGKNRNFENKLKEKDAEFKEQAREAFNVTQYGFAKDFTAALDSAKRESAQQFQELFSGNKTGEEIAQILGGKEAGPVKGAVLSSVNKCFHTLETANQNSFYKLMDTRSYKMVRVGGKTAEEIWGEKYKSVTDPELKETLYKAELLNAAIKGKEPVSIDIYSFNKKLDLKQNVSTPVVQTREQLVQQKAFTEEIEALHQRLLEAKEKLADTQKDPEANFNKRVDQEGSEYYRNMTTALQKCIDLSDRKSRSANFHELKEALSEYQKASRVYVKERDNLTHAWLSDGRTRLREAKNAVSDVSNTLDRLGQLSKGTLMDTPAYCNNSTMFNLDNSFTAFEKACKRSGLKGPEDITPEETQAVKDKAQKAAETRRKLQQKITRMSQDAVTTAEKLDYSIGKETMMQKARNYYKKVYADQIRKASAEELSQMAKNMNTDAFNLKFHQDAEKLSEDPLFVKSVQEAPKSYIPTYHANKIHEEQKQAEKAAEKQQASIQNFDHKVEQATNIINNLGEKNVGTDMYRNACAIIFADSMVKQGVVQPGQAAFNYASTMLKRPAFVRSLYKAENGNEKLSADEVKNLLTGPNARQKVDAAMQKSVGILEREKVANQEKFMDSKEFLKNKDFKRPTDEIQNEMWNMQKAQSKPQGRGMRIGGQ